MTVPNSHVDHPPAPGVGSRAAGWAGKLVQLAFLLVTAGLLCLYGRLGHTQQQQVVEITRIFLGILMEAVPFMLVGALVGGLIEVFVSPDGVARVFAGRKRRSVFVAAAMGLVFPVCECAIVPVVRRLVRKGVPLSAAVAFLLAGPIVNPLVLASTALAYGGNWHMVAARGGLGYFIAVVVGLAIGRVFTARQALLAQSGAEHADEHAHDDHDHDHDHDGACGAAAPGAKLPRRLISAVGHAAWDFVDVGRFLVIAAFLTAVLRTLVQREDLLAGATGRPLSILAMMALAFVLNLCSEADAFVAASLGDIVGFSGQMAFLVFGPMLDMKLVAMYLSLFRKRAILALTASVVAVVFITVLLYSYAAELVQLCVLIIERS